MKTLKIFAVVAVVAALTVASVMTIAANTESKPASGGPFEEFLNEEELLELVLSHLTDTLALTEAQQAEIRPILKAHLEQRAADMQARREQMRQNLQSTAAERQAMVKEVEEQLAGILTEEQMQDLRQMAEEKWGHWLEMRSHMAESDFPARGHFGDTLKELNLTFEQKKDMLAIAMKYRDMHQDMRAEMQGMRAQVRTTMLDLLKQDQFDEEQVRQTYREMTAKLENVVVNGAKMLSEMKAVLTPDQQQILEEKGTAFLEQMQQHQGFGPRFGSHGRMGKHRPLFSFWSRQAEK